ncbi:formate hydrogenlyase maturation HycH family protein [Telmatospirillum siberiense]|uniref:Formate hydrogenlyase maturation protein HycH n=1 Tax=Telmatospirillum siberiense TaxID=382514 RepID=A0A2N3PPM5_9PROT|nr:formate hydrogenlyase maturation HycH family protein [Telmatospirillum siberiense]PKU22361.1 formate hydrogenlyase maturation protein HycH [Telmatospirillum siberiense]
MTAGIVFYQLNAKFLERAEDVPEASQQVVYYSLAIGHHVGVFDCFKPVLRCSNALYDGILASLPSDGEARRKMAGLLRFGEITVDRSHTAMLRPAVAQARIGAEPEAAAWLDGFDASLAAIEQEPVIYLMGRRLS